MSAVKYDVDLATTETQVLQMDRWSYPAYSVNITSGSALVEGTLQRVNQGETPAWFTLNARDGTALTALTGFAALEPNTPIDAIRITATGATVGTVIQTGD